MRVKFEMPAAAERTGRLQDLGELLRHKVLERMADLPKHILLFVNLHPHELNDRRLLEG